MKTATQTHDVAYDEYSYLDEMAGYFAAATTNVKHLFRTNATGLWDAYLNAFPADERQHHNCNACRRFIETYGSLVVIREDGSTYSPFWGVAPVDPLYNYAFGVLGAIIAKARVTGVFASSEKVWGLPKNRDHKHNCTWHHLAVTPDAVLVHKDRVLTAHQAEAKAVQDYQTVLRALVEFDLPALNQVVTLLESDTMYRSEKVLGPAKWLRDRQQERSNVKGPVRDNLLWLAVSEAPDGFLHPRSSMIGTLLDDVAAGMDFETVSARFKAKMHPLQYQRPQAAPAAGTIAQAEKLVEKMGLAPALRRRFARLDDLQALWSPANLPERIDGKGGVFGHLKAKDTNEVKPLDLPPVTMTWDKFARTVMPEAAQIEYFAAGRDAYTALVTAADPDAPPLLQWDNPDRRNPVSLYLWNGGSTPGEFGIAGQVWHKVNAITYRPSMWHDPDAFAHQHTGVIFIIDGAKDHRRGAGLALFPEILRSELHSVRSVIEAYSKTGELEGREEASACGVLMSKGTDWNGLLRVTTKTGQVAQYKLDRWD